LKRRFPQVFGCSYFIAKFCSVLSATAIFVLLLSLSSGGVLFGAATSTRDALKNKYRRQSEIPFPESDPYSKAKLKLGRMLFFDPILSGTQRESCSSCHSPSLSWADGRSRAIGETHKSLPLRTPTLLNVAWTPRLGWDGHFASLEVVAVSPITSADMMGASEKIAVDRVAASPRYIEAFGEAFGTNDINMESMEMALATFERSIVSTEAPFDRWIDGDETAIGEPAKRGFDLFNGKANCAACHSGWTFTDSSFHDIGTAHDTDTGRGKLFPRSIALQYAFKTPTLRDVAQRAPYAHDGSVQTLEQIVDLYDRGGIDRPSRAPEIYPLKLANDEKADLISFLRTLTGRPQSSSPMLLQ
jgi:cytochrome c peroxidase